MSLRPGEPSTGADRSRSGGRRAPPIVLWPIGIAVGGATMVVELTGARILAPAFGASVVPWTAVIAMVLSGVALGSAWGGRLSLHASGGRLAQLLCLCAACVLVPAIGVDVPVALLGTVGVIAGSVLSALLFLPASFLLGAVAPLLLRLAISDAAHAGRWAGAFGSANAIGAVFGTLVTGFVLIPAFPLTSILALTAATLVAASVVVWLVDRRR